MASCLRIHFSWCVLTPGSGFPKLVSHTRLCECVDALLSMQHEDGGFGSYERPRGGAWLEVLNPAEVFDRIMVEYTYPECTTSVLTVLSIFHSHFPNHKSAEIESAVASALKYILESQRLDGFWYGSWYGSWAICFTYATSFALESLETVHQTYQTSVHARRACDWLVLKQKSDGGSGEHYSSCEVKEYVQHDKSQVVNMTWAVLALMSAQYPGKTAITKGLEVSLGFQDNLPLSFPISSVHIADGGLA